MILKVLDKNTSLAEKKKTVFREQGIMITSILTAIGMAISILVEALFPGGGGATTQGKGGGKPENVKEWLRNKLKALASLPRRLSMEEVAALPGIIEAIISWILNRAKEVVGWVLQNLWALVIGVRELLYMYMVMRSHGNNIQPSKYQKAPPILITLKAMNANSLLCCSLLWV